MQEPQSQDYPIQEAHIEYKWFGSGSSAMLSYWLGAAARGESGISRNAEQTCCAAGGPANQLHSSQLEIYEASTTIASKFHFRKSFSSPL